ncbi:MAG TPA: 23S rRNA (adenine(2503)-C(2))-methyltransferase RlmN [Phycisphaerales bacterium]|nr:23S rRNA (adenine(2503)-C(2))-methyltransferase RlmN [Phycisphaerales bacterium]
MEHPPHHIFGFTPSTLREWCVERGMKPFRAGQILEWVYAHGVIDPAAMSNLSNKDREILAAEMTFLSGRTVAEQRATDGTRKLLIEWDDPTLHTDRRQAPETPSLSNEKARLLPVLDGHDPSRQTECVMIPAAGKKRSGEDRRDACSTERGRSRRTACISSQVGCPVGCRFCASGLGGLDGNLSAGRIVEQIWRLGRLAGMGRISNVVFMGMGEPLANFGPVVRAVRTIAADWGPGIGARRITISTVGMHKAIDRLADELELPVTLALSLHAPSDDLRRELIPWAEFTTIEQLTASCMRWFEKTGREITLEYILLGGVNDRAEHAEALARVAGSMRANVNLIRYNEVEGMPYRRPESGDVHRFQSVLRGRGVNAHIRASRGRDIAAACGQLRHEKAPGGS